MSIKEIKDRVINAIIKVFESYRILVDLIITLIFGSFGLYISLITPISDLWACILFAIIVGIIGLVLGESLYSSIIVPRSIESLREEAIKMVNRDNVSYLKSSLKGLT